MSDFAKEIISVNIEDELKQSYLSYALSVIHGRALPDIRDGLKPVHRRILYAMYDLKNYYNKPYKKSARVVGDVIGKYHPHGDSAVYDAMVRMAQDFSMRYPIIEGQGNFGSIDGDPPAAMRYTEVRMAKITDQMLGDIEKETVSYSPNYDGSEHIDLVTGTLGDEASADQPLGRAHLPPALLRRLLAHGHGRESWQLLCRCPQGPRPGRAKHALLRDDATDRAEPDYSTGRRQAPQRDDRRLVGPTDRVDPRREARHLAVELGPARFGLGDPAPPFPLEHLGAGHTVFPVLADVAEC